MVSVTLHFENEDEKNYFLGQLSDGFGENYVEIRPMGNLDFYSSHTFRITNDRNPFGDDSEYNTWLDEVHAKAFMPKLGFTDHNGSIELFVNNQSVGSVPSTPSPDYELNRGRDKPC
jgi:hypothetical protein